MYSPFTTRYPDLPKDYEVIVNNVGGNGSNDRKDSSFDDDFLDGLSLLMMIRMLDSSLGAEKPVRSEELFWLLIKEAWQKKLRLFIACQSQSRLDKLGSWIDCHYPKLYFRSFCFHSKTEKSVNVFFNVVNREKTDLLFVDFYDISDNEIDEWQREIATSIICRLDFRKIIWNSGLDTLKYDFFLLVKNIRMIMNS